MKNTRKPFTILIAEDDPDDRLILKDAFEEAGVHHVIHYVEDGQELMDYLHARRKHSRPNNAPHPAIILLDLNMPRKKRTRRFKRNQIRPGPEANPRYYHDNVKKG